MSLRSTRRLPGLDTAVVVGVVVATWLPELAIAERKYGLFEGGFGQSHALHGPIEALLFLAASALAQLVLVGFAYLLFRGRRGGPATRLPRLFAFAVLTIILAFAALAARLELLSYFSDAVSFELIRNLGGGSLIDAFLFSLNNGMLYLAAAAIGLAVFFALWWLVCRYARRHPPADVDRALTWRAWLALLALLPPIAFAADRVPDVRYAANRMIAFGLMTQALGHLTDFDGDGYSWFSALVDDAPFDAARHPLALDVPNDGIDQDGFAGDFRYAGHLVPYQAPALPPHPRHLVLIVLESTRADILGKRIDGKPVAPNLEALAQAGSVIPEAYSHVGFTTGSLKSLFSGQLAPAPGSGSLFRDLKHDGYRIAVFSGQPETFGDISSVTGERANANIFVDATTLKSERAFAFSAEGSLLVDEGKLLREWDRTLGSPAGWRQPTFVYLNFQSAHFPYHHDGMIDRIEPQPLSRGQIELANRARLERTYWNAVAYADQRIGEVIARLKALGVWNDTLLAVTADHGESLFDDGFLGHGHMINRQQTRIPFVLSQPGVRVARPVGLEDYRAILLALLAGRPVTLPDRQVFQHIGALETPTEIGTVTPGGVWTTLGLDGGELWLSDTGLRRRYDALPPGSAARARADGLVREWERRRWEARLLAGG